MAKGAKPAPYTKDELAAANKEDDILRGLRKKSTPQYASAKRRGAKGRGESDNMVKR